MTTFHQKLAGLTVLGIVSGVSLLTGGIMLGGASADDGDTDNPSLGIIGSATRNVRVLSSMIDGEGGGCFIAYGGEGDFEPAVPFGAVKGEGPITIAGPAGAGEMKVERNLRIVSSDNLKDPPAMFTHAIEAKPISPDKIERLKASGELKTFSPEDCKVVTPEEMEGLVPFEVKKAP